MKIYIDSANLHDIEEGLKRGFALGVTTNPSLLAKEPRSSFETHIYRVVELIKKYRPGIHLSVEVFSRNQDEILEQAQRFVEQFNYPQISIKVHVGWNELETIKKLREQGISVNCTACMDVTQAMMAAHAGANYVSLFWGRIKDGGIDVDMAAQRYEALQKGALDTNDFDPAYVVSATRKLIDAAGLDTEIIAGSMRTVNDIRDSALAGAHIVTIPPKFYPDMMRHYKTDQVIDQFLGDFSDWLKQ